MTPWSRQSSPMWQALPRWFPTIALDEFTIMPNHVHLIVWLQACDEGTTSRAATRAAPTTWTLPEPTTIRTNPGLGDVIGAFKSLVSKVYRDWARAHDPGRDTGLWQRRYYDHIIRNQRSLERIRDYIANNLALWDIDAENPSAGGVSTEAYYRAKW